MSILIKCNVYYQIVNNDIDDEYDAWFMYLYNFFPVDLLELFLLKYSKHVDKNILYNETKYRLDNKSARCYDLLASYGFLFEFMDIIELSKYAKENAYEEEEIYI